MPETKSKPKESFEGLVRRFNKDIQRSGKLIQARKIRFFKKKSNKRALKETALRRKKIDDKTEYLKRVGKIKESFPGAKTVLKLN